MMKLFNHVRRKTQFINRITTTAALCIVSVAGYLSPGLADAEKSSPTSLAAPQAPAQDKEQNARLAIPIGQWHGHILNKDDTCNLIADIKLKDGELEGTITCNGKQGTSKHYISGSWDSSNHEFLLKDVGLDIEGGVAGWYPASFDKYCLRPVDGDNKLVGTCHQSDENKISWITLLKDQSNNSNMAGAPLPSQTVNGNDLNKTPNNNLTANQQQSLKLRSATMTPEGKLYMTRIETAVKSHWHPPGDELARRVSLHFHIHDDGSVSNIKLDPSSNAIDEYVTTSFQAIKDSAPFDTPPKALLTYPKADNGKGYVSVHLMLDSNLKGQKAPI